MRLTKAARTIKANSLLPSKNSGTFDVYDGAPPATVDAPITTQVLLVSFNIPLVSGSVVNGLFTAAPIADATGVGLGVAAWYRQSDSGGLPVEDGTVTAIGGGGDALIDNVNIAVNQNVRFISWTENEGNGD